MDQNLNLVIYDADDEMPDCGRCDHITEDFDCCGKCGPEHGWGGYTRTETEVNDPASIGGENTHSK